MPLRHHRPPLGHKARRVGAGLVNREVVLQTPNEVEEVAAAAVLKGRGIDCERLPQLHFLIVHIETTRHDPDDLRGCAIDEQRPADDARITPIRALPQLPRQQGHRCGARA